MNTVEYGLVILANGQAEGIQTGGYPANERKPSWMMSIETALSIGAVRSYPTPQHRVLPGHSLPIIIISSPVPKTYLIENWEFRRYLQEGG